MLIPINYISPPISFKGKKKENITENQNNPSNYQQERIQKLSPLINALLLAKSQNEADNIKLKIYNILKPDLKRLSELALKGLYDVEEVYSESITNLFEYLSNEELLINEPEMLYEPRNFVKFNKEFLIRKDTSSLDAPLYENREKTREDILSVDNILPSLSSASKEERALALTQLNHVLGEKIISSKRKTFLTERFTTEGKIVPYSKIATKYGLTTPNIILQTNLAILKLQLKNNNLPIDKQEKINAFITEFEFENVEKEKINNLFYNYPLLFLVKTERLRKNFNEIYLGLQNKGLTEVMLKEKILKAPDLLLVSPQRTIEKTQLWLFYVNCFDNEKNRTPQEKMQKALNKNFSINPEKIFQRITNSTIFKSIELANDNEDFKNLPKIENSLHRKKTFKIANGIGKKEFLEYLKKEKPEVLNQTKYPKKVQALLNDFVFELAPTKTKALSKTEKSQKTDAATKDKKIKEFKNIFEIDNSLVPKLHKIFESTPELYSKDFEIVKKRLEKSVELINSPLLDYKTFFNCAMRYPQIFLLLPERIKTNIDGFLKFYEPKGLTKEMFLHNAIKSPILFCKATSTYNNNWEQILSTFAPQDKSTNIMKVHHSLACRKIDSLENNIDKIAQYFEKQGITKENIKTCAIKAPNILSVKPETIINNIENFVKLAQQDGITLDNYLKKVLQQPTLMCLDAENVYSKFKVALFLAQNDCLKKGIKKISKTELCNNALKKNLVKAKETIYVEFLNKKLMEATKEIRDNDKYTTVPKCPRFYTQPEAGLAQWIKQNPYQYTFTVANGDCTQEFIEFAQKFTKQITGINLLNIKTCKLNQ